MKKLVLFLVVLAIVVSAPSWAAKEELRIYIWSEYMDEQKMPADFEKKFGIKVRLDFFESVEDFNCAKALFKSVQNWLISKKMITF